MSDKPKKPHWKLLELAKMGSMVALEYNEDMTEEYREMARSESYGDYYEWDMAIDVKSRSGDVVTVPEWILDKHIERAHDHNDRYGLWKLTAEARKQVDEYNKWMAKEERDLKEYKRLQQKFGDMV